MVYSVINLILKSPNETFSLIFIVPITCARTQPSLALPSHLTTASQTNQIHPVPHNRQASLHDWLPPSPNSKSNKLYAAHFQKPLSATSAWYTSQRAPPEQLTAKPFSLLLHLPARESIVFLRSLSSFLVTSVKFLSPSRRIWKTCGRERKSPRLAVRLFLSHPFLNFVALPYRSLTFRSIWICSSLVLFI